VNKIIRLMQNYLIIGLPFVIICMVTETLNPEIPFQTTSWITKIGWHALGINIMLWFTTLIIYLVTMVTSANIREKTLKRLANLQERDEREAYITGKAARSVYISTLSLTLLLLFFSVFSFSIGTNPENERQAGKGKLAASISLQFHLLNESELKSPAKTNDLPAFNSREMTPSASTMLLILLGWQLVMFSLTARKERLKGLD
jgi:hypothetical protein